MTEHDFTELDLVFAPDRTDFTDEQLLYAHCTRYIEAVLEPADIASDSMRRMFHRLIEERLEKMIGKEFSFTIEECISLKEILCSLSDKDVINLFVERYIGVFSDETKRFLTHKDRNKPEKQIVEEGAFKLTKLLIKKFVEVYEK